MKGKLVALCGYKGSGKDTAADALVENEGYVKVAFADPIRQIAKLVFGLTDEEMSDRVLKEKPLARWPYKSPREIMQLVGTEMFRTYFPDVWIMCFLRRAKSLLDAGVNVVVTDLRFENEEQAIQKMGGVIIKITRDGVGLSDPHPSEAHIANILPHYEIFNNAPTAEKFQKVFRKAYDTIWIDISYHANQEH